MEYCDHCGEGVVFEGGGLCGPCQEEQQFNYDKHIHNEMYKEDTNRFKWRYLDCAEGFVFNLDGKEFTNLNDLKKAINEALNTTEE